MHEARTLTLAVLLALLALPVRTADFPPVTDAERDLQAVADFPQAPAGAPGLPGRVGRGDRDSPRDPGRSSRRPPYVRTFAGDRGICR